MLDSLRAALLDALALFLPVDCAGCGAPDRSVCADCRLLLEPRVARRALADGTPVATALLYDGVPRRIVLAFKEELRTDLGRALAPPLAAALTVLPDGALLVPVPSSRAAFRRRGFDPVTAVARAAGFRPAPELRLRSGAKQKSLGVEERARNRAASMRSRRALDGVRVILIDDVMTTGASLAEAARAIREAGGEVVGCAAIAFTPRLYGAVPPGPV